MACYKYLCPNYVSLRAGTFDIKAGNEWNYEYKSVLSVEQNWMRLPCFQLTWLPCSRDLRPETSAKVPCNMHVIFWQHQLPWGSYVPGTISNYVTKIRVVLYQILETVVQESSRCLMSCPVSGLAATDCLPVQSYPKRPVVVNWSWWRWGLADPTNYFNTLNVDG